MVIRESGEGTASLLALASRKLHCCEERTSGFEHLTLTLGIKRSDQWCLALRADQVLDSICAPPIEDSLGKYPHRADTTLKMEPVESPRKRVKLDNAQLDGAGDADLPSGLPSAPAPAASTIEDAQSLKESEVGITVYINADNPGFSGLLKKR